jgi:hypothetical protein
LAFYASGVQSSDFRVPIPNSRFFEVLGWNFDGLPIEMRVKSESEASIIVRVCGVFYNFWLRFFVISGIGFICMPKILFLMYLTRELIMGINYHKAVVRNSIYVLE